MSFAAVEVLREAGQKLQAAAREVAHTESRAETWLQRIIVGQIRERANRRNAAYWERTYPGLSADERAQLRMRRTIRRSTAAGVVAAALTTAGELTTLATDGLAAPFGLGLAAAGIACETLYTTVLRVDLAWDLASIHGVPLDTGDVGDLATLLGFSVGVDFEEVTGERSPNRLRATLKLMRADQFAHDVGNRLIQVSVLRNAVPFVNVLVSAVSNQLGMRRYARAVEGHMKRRRAIVDACRELHLETVADAALLLEGAWLLATCDGQVDHGEALAFSVLIDQVPDPLRSRLKAARFTDDEEAWFERLAQAGSAVYAPLVEILTIVASADRQLDEPERRFLRRVEKVTGRRIQLG